MGANLDRLHKVLDAAKDGKHTKAHSDPDRPGHRQKAHDRFIDRIAKLRSDCHLS